MVELEFIRDDSTLAAGYNKYSENGVLQLWTLPEGELLQTKELRAPGNWIIWTMAISPSGEFFAWTLNNGGVYLMELASGEVLDYK